MSWDSRNLGLLAAGQALGSSGVSMIVLVGGIVGSRLAPSPVWSTLPVAAMVVGLAASRWKPFAKNDCLILMRLSLTADPRVTRLAP